MKESRIISGASLPVFQPVGNDAQGQSLNSRGCLLAGVTVDHHAWQVSYLGEPAAIFFAFKLDGEVHRAWSPLAILQQPETRLQRIPRQQQQAVRDRNSRLN